MGWSYPPLLGPLRVIVTIIKDRNLTFFTFYSLNVEAQEKGMETLPQSDMFFFFFLKVCALRIL